MKSILIAAIRVYRKLLSPFIGNQCRFTPTCSHYGEEAIRTHGAVEGGILTVARICRCHPYYKGAYVDPVPETGPFARLRLRLARFFGTTSTNIHQ
jgi:putative membrane protein insertion efficiency factor